LADWDIFAMDEPGESRKGSFGVVIGNGGANNASTTSSTSCKTRIFCLIELRSTGFHVVTRRVSREKEDGSGFAVVGSDAGANNASKA